MPVSYPAWGVAGVRPPPRLLSQKKKINKENIPTDSLWVGSVLKYSDLSVGSLGKVGLKSSIKSFKLVHRIRLRLQEKGL